MEYYPCKTNSNGACSLFFLFSLFPSLLMLSSSFYHLSFHFPHLQLTVCLSLYRLRTSYSPPLSLFPFLSPLFSPSFSIPHGAASSEISVWNLPPIRGLNPPVQPPAAHPWQLFCCLKCFIRGAEAHLTLPGNWSLFRTGRDKCASPSASKCKLNGPSLWLH